MMAVRYIYFPTDKKPVIIFVTYRVGNEYRGSTLLKDIEECRFAFYPVARCQEYTDELWEAVQNWLSDRDKLNDRYEKLMKKGLKAL